MTTANIKPFIVAAVILSIASSPLFAQPLRPVVIAKDGDPDGNFSSIPTLRRMSSAMINSRGDVLFETFPNSNAVSGLFLARNGNIEGVFASDEVPTLPGWDVLPDYPFRPLSRALSDNGSVAIETNPVSAIMVRDPRGHFHLVATDVFQIDGFPYGGVLSTNYRDPRNGFRLLSWSASNVLLYSRRAYDNPAGQNCYPYWYSFYVWSVKDGASRSIAPTGTGVPGVPGYEYYTYDIGAPNVDCPFSGSFDVASISRVGQVSYVRNAIPDTLRDNAQCRCFGDYSQYVEEREVLEIANAARSGAIVPTLLEFSPIYDAEDEFPPLPPCSLTPYTSIGGSTFGANGHVYAMRFIWYSNDGLNTCNESYTISEYAQTGGVMAPVPLRDLPLTRAPGGPVAPIHYIGDWAVTNAGIILTAAFDWDVATAQDDVGIWRYHDNEWQLLLREGDEAPGANGEAFEFSQTPVVSVNAKGDIVIEAQTASHSGLWLWDSRSEVVRPLVVSGQQVDLDDSIAGEDLHTIVGASFMHGRRLDGQSSGINNAGDIVVTVGYELTAGEYEGAVIQLTADQSSCPVDVDGDGRIDIDDLYYITQHPTDINGDGNADAEDAHCLERYLRRNELEDMAAGRR